MGYVFSSEGPLPFVGLEITVVVWLASSKATRRGSAPPSVYTTPDAASYATLHSRPGIAISRRTSIGGTDPCVPLASVAVIPTAFGPTSSGTVAVHVAKPSPEVAATPSTVTPVIPAADDAVPRTTIESASMIPPKGGKTRVTVTAGGGGVPPPMPPPPPPPPPQPPRRRAHAATTSSTQRVRRFSTGHPPGAPTRDHAGGMRARERTCPRATAGARPGAGPGRGEIPAGRPAARYRAASRSARAAHGRIAGADGRVEAAAGVTSCRRSRPRRAGASPPRGSRPSRPPLRSC